MDSMMTPECQQEPGETFKRWLIFVVIIWALSILLALLVYVVIEKPGIDSRVVFKRDDQPPEDPADSGDVLITFKPALNLFEMIEISIGLDHINMELLFQTSLDGPETGAINESEVSSFLQLQPTNDNRLRRSELMAAYDKLSHLGLHAQNLEVVLSNPFFYLDKGGQHFDFAKVQLFNILYCGGELEDKAQQMFKMLRCQSGYIIDESQQFMKTLDNLTNISCFVIADAIEQSLDIDDGDAKARFEQLNSLYRMHPKIIREFTSHLRLMMFEAAILPADQQMPGLGSDGRLSRGAFMRVMEKPGPLMFMLVQPKALRAQFSEFVIKKMDQSLIT